MGVYDYDIPAFLNVDTDAILKDFRSKPIPQYVPPPEPVQEESEFVKGVKRGTEGLKSAAYGAAGLIGSGLGIDEVRDWGYQGFQEHEAEAAKHAGRVQNIEDIKSIGDAGDWAAGTFGSLVPSIGEAAVTSAAGAVIGSAIGPEGTIAGGVTGLVGRQAAKSMVRKLAREYVREGMERQVAKEVAKKAVESLPAKALRRNIGTKVGIVAGTAPVEAGGMWGEGMQQGKDNPYSAAVFGTLSGLSELLGGEAELIDVFTNPARQAVKGNVLKRIGVELGKTIPQEAGQEATQEVLSIINRKVADPSYDMFGEDARSRVLNSAAAGALGGVAFGGVGGVMSGGPKTQTEVEAGTPDTQSPVQASETDPWKAADETPHPVTAVEAEEQPVMPEAPKGVMTKAVAAGVSSGLIPQTGLGNAPGIVQDTSASAIGTIPGVADASSAPPTQTTNELVLDEARDWANQQIAAGRTHLMRQNLEPPDIYYQRLIGEYRRKDRAPAIDQTAANPETGPKYASVPLVNPETGATEIVKPEEVMDRLMNGWRAPENVTPATSAQPEAPEVNILSTVSDADRSLLKAAADRAQYWERGSMKNGRSNKTDLFPWMSSWPTTSPAEVAKSIGNFLDGKKLGDVQQRLVTAALEFERENPVPFGRESITPEKEVVQDEETQEEVRGQGQREVAPAVTDALREKARRYSEKAGYGSDITEWSDKEIASFVKTYEAWRFAETQKQHLTQKIARTKEPKALARLQKTLEQVKARQKELLPKGAERGEETGNQGTAGEIATGAETVPPVQKLDGQAGEGMPVVQSADEIAEGGMPDGLSEVRQEVGGEKEEVPAVRGEDVEGGQKAKGEGQREKIVGKLKAHVNEETAGKIADLIAEEYAGKKALGPAWLANRIKKGWVQKWTDHIGEVNEKVGGEEVGTEQGKTEEETQVREKTRPEKLLDTLEKAYETQTKRLNMMDLPVPSKEDVQQYLRAGKGLVANSEASIQDIMEEMALAKQAPESKNPATSPTTTEERPAGAAPPTSGEETKTENEADHDVKRFAVGKSLSKEERKKVLGSLKDVYREAGLKKEYKGIDSRGEEMYGYPHEPDLFLKSDITGAMLRYYVTMPDGKIAHPSELFPDYSQAQIDKEMASQDAESENTRRNAQSHNATAERLAKDSPGEVDEYFREKSEESKKRTAHDGWGIAPPDERVMLERDGKFYSVYKGAKDEMAGLKQYGWNEVGEKKPLRDDSGLNVEAFLDREPVKTPDGGQDKAEYEFRDSNERLETIQAANKFIELFDSHGKGNAIAGKFGQEIYFEPDARAVVRLSREDAWIEYALHSVTKAVGDDFNRRTADRSKIKNVDNIDSIIRDADGYYEKDGKVYYFKYSEKEKKLGSAVLLEMSRDGKFEDCRYVTQLPNRKIRSPQVSPATEGVHQEQTGGTASLDIENSITPLDDKVKSDKATSGTEDVGENLWYNRRNRTGRGIAWDDVKGLNDTLRVKEVTKSKVWPRPDYDQLIADGMNPFFARIVKMAYDGIAQNPSGSSDTDLQRYISVVGRVKDAVFEWAKDNSANKEFMDKVVASFKAHVPGQVTSITSMLDGSMNFSDALLKRLWPGEMEQPRYGRFSRGSEALEDVKSIGGNRALQALQPSNKDIRKALDDLSKGWPAKQEAWQRQGYAVHDSETFPVQKVYRYTDDGKVEGWNYQGGSFYTSQEEARKSLTDKGAFLLTGKSGRIVGGFATRVDAESAAREKVKREGRGDKEVRGMNVSDSERIGPPRRNADEDISSQRLMDTFGFRGVNFGRKGYINDAARQEYLNHAYDALQDLAETLGIPAKALSMNGELGIAFGAQGRGGTAAAHFVPGVNEINLTRNAGAGTLAHEWAHALDHYFGVQAGLAKEEHPYLSERGDKSATTFTGDIRPEIVQAYNAVVAAMSTRPMTENEWKLRQQGAKEKSRKLTQNWLNHARKMLESSVTEVKEQRLAEFDELAKRILDGDLGKGYVDTGNRQAYRPTIAALRNLFKDATGRILDKETSVAIQSWSHGLGVASEAAGAVPEHLPQVGTDYRKESQSADKQKKGKPYWSTRREMFARAFELFVNDRLMEQNFKNTFLTDADLRNTHPYPRNAERDTINKAFGVLVDTIETKETDKGVVMFAQASTVSSPSGLPASDIRTALEPVHKSMPNSPPWRVVQTAAELPVGVLTDATNRKIPHRLLQAVYYRGEALYVADNFSSVKEAQRRAIHEVVAHFGLHAIMPVKQFDTEMLRADLYYINKNRDRYLQLVEGYGLDRSTRQGRIMAAEEMIAHEAETGATSTVLTRIIAAVKEFLRSIGIDLGYGEAEIRELLGKARRFVEGKETGGNVQGTGIDYGTLLSTLRDQGITDAELQSFAAYQPGNAINYALARLENVKNQIVDKGVSVNTTEREVLEADRAKALEAIGETVKDYDEPGRMLFRAFYESDQKQSPGVVPFNPERGHYAAGENLKGSWWTTSLSTAQEIAWSKSRDGRPVKIVALPVEKIPAVVYIQNTNPAGFVYDLFVGLPADVSMKDVQEMPVDSGIRYALADRFSGYVGEMKGGEVWKKIARLLNPLDWSRFALWLKDVTPQNLRNGAASFLRTAVFEGEVDENKKPFVDTGIKREETKLEYLLRFLGFDGPSAKATGVMERLKKIFTQWESSDRTTEWGRITDTFRKLAAADRKGVDLLLYRGDVMGKVFKTFEMVQSDPKTAKVSEAAFAVYQRVRTHIDTVVADAIEELSRQFMYDAGLPEDVIEKHLMDYRNRREERPGWLPRNHGEGDFMVNVYHVINGLKWETRGDKDSMQALLPYFPSKEVADEIKKIADMYGLKYRHLRNGGQLITTDKNASARFNKEIKKLQEQIAAAKGKEKAELETKLAEVERTRVFAESLPASQIKRFKEKAAEILPKISTRNELAIRERKAALEQAIEDGESLSTINMLKDELKKYGDGRIKVKVYMRLQGTERSARKHTEEVKKDLRKAMPNNFRDDAQYETEYRFAEQLSESMYGDMKNDFAMEQAQLAAINKAAATQEITKEEASALRNKILQSTAEVLMARGAGKHQIRRAQYLIEGYDTENTIDAFHDYMTGTAGMLSKARYAHDQFELFRYAKPEVKAWAERYIKDNLRNMGIADMVSGNLRSLACFFYLGFKVSSMIINATQPWTLGIAELGMHTKRSAVWAMGKAQKDIFSGKLSEDEKKLFASEIFKLQEMETAVNEMSGSREGATSKASRFMHTLTDKALAPFQEVELLNRKTVILAAYRTFLADGMSRQEAIDKALEVNRKVNFEMSRANLPAFAQKPIGRTVYALQSFMWNNWNWVYNRLTSGKKEDMKAMLRYTAAMAIIGGAAALPGWDELDKLYQMLFGESPKLALKKWTREHAKEYGTLGEYVHGFAWHGLASATGVNISNAIRLQIPIVSPLLGGGTLPEAAGGVFTGLAQKGFRAATAASRGDIYRTVENLSPEALSGGMRAYRMANKGATTGTGKIIFDENGKPMKYSTGEAVKRALGFAPSRVSERNDLTNIEMGLTAHWKEERGDLLAQLRLAEQGADRRKVMLDIIRFNHRLNKSQAKGLVPVIKSQTISQALKNKPNKGKGAWEREQLGV
jgi:hypothetical protein